MYLQKIQKIMNIMGTVIKVLMVMSFAAGGLSIIFGIITMSGAEKIVAMMSSVPTLSPVVSETADINFKAEGAVLIADGIAAILTGVVMVFAVNYLSQEKVDGDPFTESGAEAVKKLGITSIVAAVVSSVIQGVIFGVFDIDAAMASSTNDTGITTGLLLLFFSLILHYGAQLRTGKTDNIPE